MRKVSTETDLGWGSPSSCSYANSPSENVRNGAAFRCIEAIGQAIAYGMNTQTTSDPLTGLYVSRCTYIILSMRC